MNNTITLSQLITRLATSTGVDNNNARRFLRSFFATVEDAVANGETVSIKGIGTFRAASNDLTGGKLSVSFTPDETIARELNKPFEMFEAVELADDVKFTEQDDNTDDNTIVIKDNLEVVDLSDRIETVDVSDRMETVDAIERMETATVEKPVEETCNVPEQREEEPVEEPKDTLADRVKTILWPEEEEENEEEEEDKIPVITPPTKPKVVKEPVVEETEKNEADPTDEPDHKKIWIWGAIAVLAVSAVAYLAAVFTTPVDPVSTGFDNIQDLPADTTSLADNTVSSVSVEEVQTPAPEPAAATPAPKEETQTETAAPSPKKEPVYDTVEISLIRLAKKHYGESSYWVFIYEANRDIISNPNRIRPGQKVVIPDRSTFPGNSIAETVAIAKQKQSEILNKFK